MKRIYKLLAYLVPSAVILFLVGCVDTAEIRARNQQHNTVTYGPYRAQTGPGISASPRYQDSLEQQSYWIGDGVSGSPRITVRLGEQKAYFYKGGSLVGVSPVSTGRPGYRTPTGSFRVIQKERVHYSTLYGDYVDGNGSVVVGGVAVRRDRRPSGTRFQGAPMPYFMRVHGAVDMHAGFLPGYPASHGCIRLPNQMAEVFYANTAVGTPVSVAP